MIYLFHQWMILQIFHNLFRILSMSLQTQAQGFCTLQQQECCKRRNGSTCITQQNCSDIGSKSCFSGCLCKFYPMVAGVWFRNPWILTACCPVKGSTIYDHTAKCCAVTSDELCGRMENNICTVLNRTNQIWCSKSIVNHQW